MSVRSSAHNRIVHLLSDLFLSKSHSRPVILVWAVLLTWSSLLTAQTLSGLEQGLKPFGSYQAGGIDTVSMTNLSVGIHIPLISYPERGGKVNVSYSLVYESPSETFLNFQKYCPKVGAGGYCYPYVGHYSLGFGPFIGPSPMFQSPLQLVMDQGPSLVNPVMNPNPSCDVPNDSPYPCQTEASLLEHYQVYEEDGASHPMYSVDTTGTQWRSPDLSGMLLDVSRGAVIDRQGNQYLSSGPYNLVPVAGVIQPNYTMCCSSFTSMEDANGNRNSYSGGTGSTGLNDTMGRRLPSPLAGQVAGSISSCPLAAELPAVTSAYIWTPPGPGGQGYALTFCYAAISITVNPPDCANMNQEGSQYDQTYWCRSQTLNEIFLQSVVLPNGTSWTFQYDQWADIHKVTLPTGGSITYNWELNTACTTSHALFGTFWTWKSLLTSRIVDSLNGTSEWDYSHDLVGTARAITTTTVTDPLGNDEVHHLSGLGSSGCDAVFETEVDRYAGTGASRTELDSTTTTYADNIDQTSQTAINVRPTAKITTDYTSGKVTQATYQYDSGVSGVLLGNRLQESIYDFGAGQAGSLLRQTNTGYMNLNAPNAPSYLASNLLDLPYSVQVCDGNSNQLSMTQYGYDQSSLVPSGFSGTATLDATPYGGTTRGNNTSVSRWLSTATVPCASASSSPAVADTATYYDSGMKQSTADPLGNGSTYSYANTYSGAYLTTSTNAKAQSTTYSYDLNSGAPLTVTDANNQTTNYSYADSMFRLTAVNYPNGGSAQYCYSDLSTANCSGALTYPSVLETVDQSPNPTKYLEADIDGLGRKTSTKVLSGGASISTTDFGYDPMGRTQYVTNPYVTSSDSTYGATSYAFDALGRTLYQCNPDNGTGPTDCSPGSSYRQFVYTGNATTQYDELRNSWTRTTDALGRLTQVVEPGSLMTSYGYDALGNLLSVSQLGISGTDAARTRGFSYDSLSRLVSSSNPEAGDITYSYDAASRLIQKTSGDPNQQSGTSSVGYCYDNLNRMQYKFYGAPDCPSGSDSIPTDAVAMYNYDTSPVSGAAYTVGRMTDAATLNSGSIVSEARSYAYDPMGRLLTEDQCPSSPCSSPYTFSYLYDHAGNPTSANNGISGANALSFGYSYDGAGRLSQATQGNSALFVAAAQSGSPAGYNAAGLLQSGQLGVISGTATVSVARTYDNRLRVIDETDGGVQQITPAQSSTGTITISGIAPGISGIGTVTIQGSEGTHQQCPPGGLAVKTQTGGGSGVGAQPNSQGGGCTLVSDTGTISITFQPVGVTRSASYGAGDTTATMAAKLAAALSTSPVVVSAVASGSTVTLKAAATGSSSNYNYTTSGGDFTIKSPANTLTGSLSGGSNSGTATDSGNVTVVLGTTTLGTANWVPGDTSATLAAKVANALSSSSLVSNQYVSGSSIVPITSLSAGAATNLSLFASVADGGGGAAQFSATASGMSGGADGNTQRATVYSYDLTGQYQANGNITGMTDSVMGVWSYGYDGLNRLTSAGSSSGYMSGQRLCMTYDSFGNRTAQYQTSGSCPSSVPVDTQFNALNEVTFSTQHSQVYGSTYSAARNVTNDGLNQYLYDAENRVCAVRGMTGTVTRYAYDASGWRMGKGNASTFDCTSPFALTTQYLYGLGGQEVTEVDNGAWKSSDAYVGGKLLGTYDANGLHYHLTDWLGTRRVQLNALGEVEETCQSLPFGDGLNCTGQDATAKHYTGKERDTESGLDYFGARYYGSSMGRFVSPDSHGGTLSNPQTLNRYAYALNNPLIFIDPTGHDCVYASQLDSHGLPTVKSGDCKSDKDDGVFYDGHLTFSSIDMNGNFLYSGSAYKPGADPYDPDGNALYNLSAGVTAQAGPWLSPQGIATFYGASAVGGALLYEAGATAGSELVSLGLDAGEGGGSTELSMAQRYAQAQEQFPNKSGLEDHHIQPKYLGGDPAGPTAEIPSAYHQQITNAFRQLAPYGRPPLAPDVVQEIMRTVYSHFPLP